LVAAKVYVEGGGSGRALRTACRQGFRTLLDRAGLKGRISKIDPCGSRAETIKDFCIALRNAAPDEFICLLVDSDGPVSANSSPWLLLGNRPPGAKDENAHLMVQCMEAWFLADKEALVRFFGQGFRQNPLPNRTDVENIPKRDIFAALEGATTACVPKGQYSKGTHAFEVLAMLDPDKVEKASPSARRLFDTLRNRTQGTES
jgi:hypothetical protein